MQNTEYEIKELHNELATKLGKTDKFSEKEQTIREHTDMLLDEAFNLYNCNYINQHEYKLLCYACERHDYGKLNKKMQERMKKKSKFDSNNELMHNLYSALFIHEKDFENYSDFLSVLYAVLYHHDNKDVSFTPSSWISNTYGIEAASVNKHRKKTNFNLEDLFEEFFDNYKTKGAEKPPEEALDDIDTMILYRDCDESNENSDKTYNQMIKMKGLLHKCDYSASASEICEYQNNFLLDALELHLKALASENKKASWNDLQNFTRDNAEHNIIVVAPTGAGKTEAGLLWAGNNKCFFVLPLKTAINAIYDRIRTHIIKDKDINERIAILHSDMQSYYYNEVFNSSNQDEENLIFDYINRSRQLSLPITVSTMDQLFDFTLKYYGYELKLATLSYSKIIIDEIQMYSADLLAYLIFGIEKIVEMGGKVAVLTATLPPFVKQKLCDAIGQDCVSQDFSYMGITRHNIKVYERQLSSADIASFWRNSIDLPSCKILVICNSIGTAQRIYNELKQSLDDIKINLLHSRFTSNDRSEKETAIMETGKTECSSHEIWVATSVVEASLDIDFDFLFTELLDLFSLFQRLGRINRKGYKGINAPNCYIYTELQDKPLEYYRKNDKQISFVDHDIYDLSKKAILTVDGIISEEKKTDLINTYLSEENLHYSGYVDRYNKALNYLKQIYTYEKNDEKHNIRNIDNIDIIPDSVYEDNMETITDAEEHLNSKELTRTDRIKYTEIIRGFIVSVPYWMAASGQTNKITTIKLNRYIHIPVVECDYTSEIGLTEIHKIAKNGKASFFNRRR
ncbi:MAG: CRISPR-associated helicase Cas3' [Clostridium sp.]|nr:CRISPR-associated helicase Cas3' [Clostridium sp.]